MNLALTIGLKGNVATVLVGTDVPFPDHRRGFHALGAKLKASREFDELQVWSSSAGRVKRKKFHLHLPAEDANAGTESTQEQPETAAPVGEPTSTDKPGKKAGKSKTAKKSAGVQPEAESANELLS